MKYLSRSVECSIHFESLHDGDLTKIGLQPKMDVSGNWTEGYGKLMVVNGKILQGEKDRTLAYQNISIHDEEEALIDLINRFAKNEKFVKSKLKVPVKNNVIDALCLHYDNCGYSETLFRLINLNMLDEIRKFWLTRYTTSSGVRYRGLVARRAFEYHLFSTGEINYNAFEIYPESLRLYNEK